jgi:hypothetical protein
MKDIPHPLLDSNAHSSQLWGEQWCLIVRHHVHVDVYQIMRKHFGQVSYTLKQFLPRKPGFPAGPR